MDLVLAAVVGVAAGILLEYAKGWLALKYERKAKAQDDQLTILGDLQEACIDLFTRAQDGLLERRNHGGGALGPETAVALYASHMRVELLRERVEDDLVRSLGDSWSERAYKLGADQPVQPAVEADRVWNALHHDFAAVNTRIGAVIRATRAGKKASPV